MTSADLEVKSHSNFKEDTIVSYAPILIFIYNRPFHLEKTLKSLIACAGFENHQVFVMADGPKNNKGSQKVSQAREVAQRILGNNAVYEFSDVNKGLARSIIGGVTNIIEKYGKVIVVEDDLLLHRQFLRYMNDALNFYDSNDLVFSVSGYAYKDMESESNGGPLFLPCISTWGWGTWKDAWDQFDPSSSGIEKLSSDLDVRARFNVNNVYPFADMLEAERAGEVESWGIRWYWTLFNLDKICCFPRESLVINGGYDESATNGRGWANNFRKKRHFVENIALTNFSDAEAKVDAAYYEDVSKALFRLNGSYLGLMKDKCRNLARRLTRLL